MKQSARILKLLTLIFIVPLIFTGCGYGFRGSGTILPPEVRRIYIPLAENRSTEPSLPRIVTEAVRDEFDKYGVVTVVDSADEADAILSLKILQIRRGSRTTTGRTDSDLQLDTSLSIAGALETISGRRLWTNPGLSISKAIGIDRNVVVSSSPDFAASGLASSDISGLSERELARGQERDAFQALAAQAARQIYDNAVAEDF